MAGLHLHQSEDLREAVAQLGTTLTTSGLGLLEKPWLVVPSAGIRQWLDGELSENLGASEGARDGVTANLAYFFPEQLVSEVERHVLASIGRTRLNWSKELIALRVFGMGLATDFSHARRIGEVLDSLNRWRPEVLLNTADDEFAEIRTIYRELGKSGLLPHEQRQLVLSTLRSEKVSTLPSLLALVGLTNMPGGRQFGELLAALSTHCRVHIFEPVTTLEPLADDPEFLPSRWNTEVAEAKQLYSELAESLGVTITSAKKSRDGSTTLRSLQESLRSGVPKSGGPADETVKIIGAYGNSRQVETLRTELLDVLGNRELGINAPDIVVITPDLPSFGPLLERHWLYERGLVESPRLPIDYAERPVGQFTNRLDASAELLRLIGTRVTVDQISRFVAIPAVGRALELEAEEQDRMWELAVENKVMAGTSNQQRAPFELMPGTNLSGVPANVGTWERFIDGVATTYVLPAEALSSVRGIGTIDDVELLSRLLPLFHLLESESHLRTNRVKKDLGSWLGLLEDWMNNLLPSTDTDRSFERELLKFREWLNELPSTIELTLMEFQELWRGIDASSTSPNVFGRGGILVCGLSALPNVPFKVVALVGFDEANLPGASVAEGLSGERQIGEPSPRQSLLQALSQGIMAATDRLIVTFNANSDESGEVIEPAIPLEELIEGMAAITGAEFKPTLTSRHEFFLSPGQDSGRTADPRVRDLAGIDTVQPSSKLDFSEYLDPDRALRRTVAVKELMKFFNNPQKFFLSSVVGTQWPPMWPETTSTARFEWDKWTTTNIEKDLIKDIREYVRVHPEIDSVAHLLSDEEILKDSLVKQNPTIAQDFEKHYQFLLDGLVLDTSKTGAIPPAIWHSAVERDEIVNKAFMIEAEFERFEQVGSPFPKTFKVGDWEVDAITELGDRAEAEFQVYRELQSGALRLVDVVTDKDRTQKSGAEKLTKSHFRSMLALLLFKSAGIDNIAAELFYVDEPKFYVKKGPSKGKPKGVGQISITCVVSAEDARDLLEEIIGVYAKVWSEPVPFFPRTVFELFSGNDGGDAWEGTFKVPGEGERPENQILYPYDFGDLKKLLAMDWPESLETLPYVSEIRRWKEAFQFSEMAVGESAFAPRIQAGLDALLKEGGV